MKWRIVPQALGNFVSLSSEDVREFDITGKPLKGWVMVAHSSWNNRDELTCWLYWEDYLPFLCQLNYPKENHLKRYTIAINSEAEECP